jgi:cation:H+ antiporter
MIQTTIPSGMSILFTPWLLDPYLLYGAIFTLLSVIYLFMTMKSRHLSAARLIVAAGFYVLFAIAVTLKYKGLV